MLTFGGFLLLGGRLADLLGRRRVFMFGLVLFALASLAGGFATSEGWLIGARAVQGLGAAILSSAALSIVTTTFRDGAERNKARGVGRGRRPGGGGVLLGGVLTEYLGWEWVLWVNVPIGIVAALIAPSLVAESRSESLTRAFDFGGAFAVTAGLSVLVYALVDATDVGWGSTQTIVLLAVAVALIAAFVAIERRSDAPLVRFGIFRLRTLTGANVVGVLTGASLFSIKAADVDIAAKKPAGYQECGCGMGPALNIGVIEQRVSADRPRHLARRSRTAATWRSSSKATSACSTSTE